MNSPHLQSAMSEGPGDPRVTSRTKRVKLLIVALLLVLSAAACGADDTRPAAMATAVSRVGFTASDMDRSIAFFTKALDFEKVSDTEVHGPAYEQLTGVFGMRARIVRLRLGDEQIELTEFLTSGGRPIPPDSRSNDRWFQHIAIVTTDMDRAYARLREHKVKHASTGPQRLPDWNKNAGGIQAFYFHDPDGHVLEIIQFPKEKGDPRWSDAKALFPGIDHTAIVVADTDASLRFYRDKLGLTVVGGSENHGQEQERLNNVFGARLRITTLKASRGMGVELLEYLAPITGRPYPHDSRANDLWHWQTSLVGRDVGAGFDALRAAKVPFITPSLVKLPKATATESRCFIVRDADGHAVQLTGE